MTVFKPPSSANVSSQKSRTFLILLYRNLIHYTVISDFRLGNMIRMMERVIYALMTYNTKDFFFFYFPTFNVDPKSRICTRNSLIRGQQDFHTDSFVCNNDALKISITNLLRLKIS